MSLKIEIGQHKDTGKWMAQITLPDGSVRSTPEGYDTREELETEIKQWLETIKAERIH